MKRFLYLAFVATSLLAPSKRTRAQSGSDRMTPEILWSLGRVSGEGMSTDGKSVLYSVRHINMATQKSTTKTYWLNLQSGQRTEAKSTKDVISREAQGWFAVDKDALVRSGNEGQTWEPYAGGLDDAENIKVSPDGRYVAFTREVLVQPIMGKDRWKDLPKTSAYVFDDLNNRHWDTWEDGTYSHLFLLDRKGSGKAVDLMAGMPYDCPTKPHGDGTDFIWHPQSTGILFVTKMKAGKAYAQSTNTDLYFYRLASGKTENWTAANKGYDVAPSFNKDGTKLAWLSMARDGFEADKNRLMVMNLAADGSRSAPVELSKSFDESTASFLWGEDQNTIYFIAPYRGTERLFEVKAADGGRKEPWQIVSGDFDVSGIIGQSGNQLIVSRNDFNHAAELYQVSLETGDMQPLTRENDRIYAGLKPSRTELRMVRTTDRKDMGVWVVYPPDFDPAKKYPTLLYCQGGPQSALTQFYSYRWNLQLMAAQGYIVVAPNRRGMPGWGTQWNEAISGDWGGQPMRDYLSAIDAVSEEPYVDKDRRGCVGASYGGYSVYMLAGMHAGRFKTFIAHDGLFDLKSWYGTTEELWFANWDLGGPYWDKRNAKTYEQFSPSNFVAKWNTPILIIQGGIDFRVPIEQGQQAFQAAQLMGLKSRMLYLPDENHWVLKPQNALAWQRTFFDWLKETL
jgi:dipeptidyl aminopeptidase/acylaminoacyl peptidase